MLGADGLAVMEDKLSRWSALVGDTFPARAGETQGVRGYRLDCDCDKHLVNVFVMIVINQSSHGGL